MDDAVTKNKLLVDEVLYASPVANRSGNTQSSPLSTSCKNYDAAGTHIKPPVYAKPVIAAKPCINLVESDKQEHYSGCTTVTEDMEKMIEDDGEQSYDLGNEDKNCNLINKPVQKPPIYAKPVLQQNALGEEQRDDCKINNSDDKITKVEQPLTDSILSGRNFKSDTNTSNKNNVESVCIHRAEEDDFETDRRLQSSDSPGRSLPQKPFLYPKPFQIREQTSHVKPPLYAKPKLLFDANNLKKSSSIETTENSKNCDEEAENQSESKLNNEYNAAALDPLFQEQEKSSALPKEMAEGVKRGEELNNQDTNVESLGAFGLAKTNNKIDEAEIVGSFEKGTVTKQEDNINEISPGETECLKFDETTDKIIYSTEFKLIPSEETNEDFVFIDKVCNSKESMQITDEASLFERTEIAVEQNIPSRLLESGGTMLPSLQSADNTQPSSALQGKSPERSFPVRPSGITEKRKIPKPARPPPPPGRQKKILSDKENSCHENVTLISSEGEEKSSHKTTKQESSLEKRRLPEIPIRTKKLDKVSEQSTVSAIDTFKHETPINEEKDDTLSRKLTKHIKDRPDGFKIPFVRRRNKAQKNFKADRQSCPIPDVTSDEILAQIHETVEDKWKCKSFSNAKGNAEDSAEGELLHRLEEQRKKTEAQRENPHEMRNTLVNEIIKEDEELEDADLFDHVLVVKLRQGNNGLEPFISFRFPPKQKYEKEVDPRVASIPQFCFPDLKGGMSENDYKEQRAGYKTNETFSFVLTDMVGKRHFGYCRQIQMNDDKRSRNNLQLPEVYCIVSPYGLFGLYAQILDEVEKQCAFSSTSVFSFLKAVLSHSLPRPGNSVEISFFSGGSQGIKSVTLHRAGDSAIHEHVDFKLLFDSIPVQMILRVVSALLLERRIILASSQLSLLSACCHAFISLLYPFQWQHTYIPVLPHQLLDMCCLPTPYLLGALSGSLEDLEELPLDEVIIIDLDEGCVLRDDEGENQSSFPTPIKNIMETSLGQVLKKNADEIVINGNKERNMLITEIFIDGYLNLIGNFQEFYSEKAEDGSGFQSLSFAKSSKSKEHRKFLKQFVKTQAFQFFIRQYNNESSSCKGLFEERLQEWQKSRRHKSSESGWHRVFGKLKGRR